MRGIATKASSYLVIDRVADDKLRCKYQKGYWFAALLIKVPPFWPVVPVFITSRISINAFFLLMTGHFLGLGCPSFLMFVIPNCTLF